MEYVQYLKENGNIGGFDKDKLNNRENSKYDLYYYGMHATLRILAKEYYARIKNINTDFNIKNLIQNDILSRRFPCHLSTVKSQFLFPLRKRKPSKKNLAFPATKFTWNNGKPITGAGTVQIFSLTHTTLE